MVPDEKSELILMRPVMGCHICMDYRKFNSWTEKYYFPMPFLAQVLAGLDGYSSHNLNFLL